MAQESFDPPVVVKIYRTYQMLGPLLNSFPKSYRYSMGESIEKAVLSMLELIFEANAINILEPLETEIVDPQDIDMVLVPMLVCDKQGNRVGFGKGYYDRYLARCRPDCLDGPAPISRSADRVVGREGGEIDEVGHRRPHIGDLDRVRQPE